MDKDELTWLRFWCKRMLTLMKALEDRFITPAEYLHETDFIEMLMQIKFRVETLSE